MISGIHILRENMDNYGEISTGIRFPQKHFQSFNLTTIRLLVLILSLTLTQTLLASTRGVLGLTSISKEQAEAIFKVAIESFDSEEVERQLLAMTVSPDLTDPDFDRTDLGLNPDPESPETHGNFTGDFSINDIDVDGGNSSSSSSALTNEEPSVGLIISLIGVFFCLLIIIVSVIVEIVKCRRMHKHSGHEKYSYTPNLDARSIDGDGKLVTVVEFCKESESVSIPTIPRPKSQRHRPQHRHDYDNEALNLDDEGVDLDAKADAKDDMDSTSTTDDGIPKLVKITMIKE